MPDPVNAIEIESLGKRYRLGETMGTDETFPEMIQRRVTNCGRWLAGRPRPTAQDRAFWALRDVSLEVPKGQVLGIIGHNGAGKSTLLKILSRITDPTQGQARVYGRIASLLEVGTGFHPELTGAENIYLNGTILGLRRQEVDEKFDQIVAFSGVAPFIDTPVKRYSSGMIVRLAFAVAAHLEPEVLIIDEVLTVGDAAFQARCLGRMRELSDDGGRTVLFVSHQLHAVKTLCDRVAWIDHGQLRQIGDTEEVISAYLSESNTAQSIEALNTQVAALGDDPDFVVREASIEQDGKPTTEVDNDRPVTIRMTYEARRRIEGLRVYFDLCDEVQDILVRSFHDETARRPSAIEPGVYTAEATIPPELLAPRNYTLILRATIYNVRPLTGDGLSVNLKVRHACRLNQAYPGDPVRAKFQPYIPWDHRKVA